MLKLLVCLGISGLGGYLLGSYLGVVGIILSIPWGLLMAHVYLELEGY